MSKKKKKASNKKNSNYKKPAANVNDDRIEALFARAGSDKRIDEAAETDFTGKLFSEEKYITWLEKEYVHLQDNEKVRERLLQLDKDLERFIGKGLFGKVLPDYMNFYSYAADEYLKKDAELTRKYNYLAVTGDTDYFDHIEIADSFLLVILCGHIASELNKVNEKDGMPSDGKMKDPEILYAKEKLLLGFFSHFDTFAGVFTNFFDAMEEEYLDDNIRDLDPFSIKQRFIAAIQSGQKNMAFKLLGRMRELDPGEDYYFEALAHYISNEKKEAIRYINKIDKTDIDYASAMQLKLECLATDGKIDAFNDCLGSNKHIKLDYWHLLWLSMTLILNIPDGELTFEIIDNDIDPDNPVFRLLKNWDYDRAEDNYYMGKSFRLVAKIVIEGLCRIEQLTELPESITESEAASRMIDNELSRLGKLKLALMLFLPSEEFQKLLDAELIGDEEKLNRQKKKAASLLTQLLIDNNPEASIIDFKASLESMIKLGDINSYIHNINSYCEQIISLADNGDPDAEELLRHAYIESVIGTNKPLDERVTAYISDKQQDKADNDITDRLILKFLSPQGKLAYDAAEWQYKKSLQEDYGWRDAGLISLGYYRILELEMNLKVVIPLLIASGSADEIKTANGSNTAALPSDPSKRFKDVWSKNVKKYGKLESNGFSGERFMLGEMRYFFSLTGTEYSEDDKVASKIRAVLPQVLNENGVESYKEGFFEELTGEETTTKFRNPPAHTQYLSYDIACECREKFRKTILEFSEMLN